MATNLIDILKGYITPDVVTKASNTLGESESNTMKAISASISTLLGGLLHKSHDFGTMDSVMGLINNTPNSAQILENLPSELSGSGSGLLGLLFGNRQDTVADGIAGNSSVKSSSAHSLMAMVASLVMGYFAKSGLTVSGITNLLNSQKESILAAVPSGLNLGSANPVGNIRHKTVHHDHNKGGAPKWLVPILVIAAALLAIYYFSKGCDQKVSEAPVTTEPSDSISTATAEELPTDTTLGRFSKFRLPNGVELNAPEYGIENKLNTWLKDESKVVDKTTWFNFDRLLFDTGKATLRAESQEQLRNMVEILKAYPAVELKIGGYTDNVGNPASNLKLSDERAKSVMNEMVTMGIASSRLNAEGYGEQFPVASNETDDGRAQNRRIAVRVTKK